MRPSSWFSAQHTHIATNKSPLILGVAFLFQQSLNFSRANCIDTCKLADT